jgi:hypothetical protein
MALDLATLGKVGRLVGQPVEGRVVARRGPALARKSAAATQAHGDGRATANRSYR